MRELEWEKDTSLALSSQAHLFYFYFWEKSTFREIIMVSATCVRLVSGTGCSIFPVDHNIFIKKAAARRFLLLHLLCLPLQS